MKKAPGRNSGAVIAGLDRLPWSWLWAATIVLVWLLVANDLGQPVWRQQHSLALLRYGAFQGSDFRLHDAWRLIASQWLHVKFFHMLFNALIIGVVGHALMRRFNPPLVLALGVLGGGAGQLATAWAAPDAYISGASQAYLALVGLALLTLAPRSAGWRVAAIGLAVAVALDVFVSEARFVKIGHAAPFALGLLCALALRLRSSVRSLHQHDA